MSGVRTFARAARASFVIALAAASLGGERRAHAEGSATGLPGRLTVDEAVSFALAHNPRLAAGRARAEAAAAQATSQSRRMLPAVRLSEEWQAYDSAYTFGSFPIREQFTNTFVASVAQPVLGLFRLGEEQAAAHATSEAALSQWEANAAELRQLVASQFLRYFEAEALESIAASSSRELDEQITISKARLTQGVITQADLLRLEVASANSRQQALQAHSQIVSARAMIFGLLGISDDGSTALVEPAELLGAAGNERARATLLLEAPKRRAELAQSLHLVDAAEHQRAARGYALLPEIELEGAYLRTDGQKFAPPNSGFVGVKAQWAIWEWGASRNLQKAAGLQAVAAQAEAEAWRRQIETEIVSHLAEADTARGAVQAANAAIASAEEAYRVTNAQVKSGTATTTDLLQAEAALTQARLNQTRARYELALAHVALARAAGQ